MSDKPTTIETHFIYPPIPDRSQDWLAQFSFNDAEDTLHGVGETEAAAVLDLLVKAVDDETQDGSPQEEVVDMAFKHWNGMQANKEPTQ